MSPERNCQCGRLFNFEHWGFVERKRKDWLAHHRCSVNERLLCNWHCRSELCEGNLWMSSAYLSARPDVCEKSGILKLNWRVICTIYYFILFWKKTSKKLCILREFVLNVKYCTWRICRKHQWIAEFHTGARENGYRHWVLEQSVDFF